MAKTNLTAVQRRSAELVDRLEGAATCIISAMESIDAAARLDLLGDVKVSSRINWAMICAYDALTLIRPCLPADRRAETKRAMTCFDAALGSAG